MTDELFIKIAGAVITIIISLITAYVLPAIKSHMTAKDMETLKTFISIAVKCADQIYTQEQWREKKEYVTNYVLGVVYDYLHIKLTPEQIDTLIEGLVNEIHDNGVRA